MDEQELLDWTAQQLRIPSFPQELWTLIPKDTRKFAENDEDEREEFLLPHARRLLRALRLGNDGLTPKTAGPPQQGDSEQQESFEPEPGEYERERAAAYAEYRAKLAADDPRVQRFRKRNLRSEDKLLTLEEAEEFLANNVNLSSLSNLSRRLSRTYPWTEKQAALFILTGETPEIAPISGHTRTHLINTPPATKGRTFRKHRLSKKARKRHLQCLRSRCDLPPYHL